MSKDNIQEAIIAHLRGQGHLTLFLDYDGTLVPIAPTPAEAIPDPPLLVLLDALCAAPALRTVILSGRPLLDLQRMLPVKGLTIAGLYGVEMQMADGNVLLKEPGDSRLESMAQLRERWAQLAGGLEGFLIEDKGEALALHARWAEAMQAKHILEAARSQALEIIHAHDLRILDGDRYVEVAPANADKGRAVDWLLTHYPVDRDLPVGFGDDNKDEAAFAVIQQLGGYAIGVGHRYELPNVDARLDGPAQTRAWLHSFLTAAIEARRSGE
jgi:trehalose 6-phosphate phosphatase